MSKTMADHARAYRQRKAAKMARLERYERALNNILAISDPTDQAHVLAWGALNAEAEA